MKFKDLKEMQDFYSKNRAKRFFIQINKDCGTNFKEWEDWADFSMNEMKSTAWTNYYDDYVRLNKINKTPLMKALREE
jgi:hypothetical protein